MPRPYILYKQRTYRFILVNPSDRLRQELGNGQHLDLPGQVRLVAKRDGIGNQHFLDMGIVDPLYRRAGKDAVGGAGIDGFGAVLFQGAGRLGQGAGGVDHVVENDRRLSLDVADQVHHLGHVGAGTALVDDRQGAAEPLGEGTRPLGPAGVGGDHDGVVVGEAPFQVLQHDGGGIEVVDRDVEEPLDLPGMEVDGDHPVRPGGGYQVSHQLRGDRGAGGNFAVLAGVAVIGDHRGNGGGGGPLQGVHHDQEFHQVIVGGRAGGLHHVDVAAADILPDLHHDFAVGEGLYLGRPQRYAEAGADLFGKGGVGVAAEHPDLVYHEMHDLL